MASPGIIDPPQHARPQRLDHIEGVRALAAIWVVLSHLWIYEFGLFAHTGAMGACFNWLLYSHLAVDIFIVLSGYCLALPLLRDGTLRGGAWAFYKRRARRILPPCYIALLFSIIVAIIIQRVQSGVWALDWPAIGINVLLLQDIHLKADIFDGPLWSIAVEWRIYLLFPMLVWALRRFGAGVLVLAAAIGFALTMFIFSKHPTALLACPWYLLLFAMGMCAATGSARQSWKPLINSWLAAFCASLLALVLLLRIYPITPLQDVVFGLHMPMIDTAAGAFAASLLIGLSRQPERQWSVGRSLLSSGPLVAVGKFSYSLYLTHAPVLLIITSLLLPHFGILELPLLDQLAIITGAGLPIIFAFAYGFHCVCERPFMNIPIVLDRRPAEPGDITLEGLRSAVAEASAP